MQIVGDFNAKMRFIPKLLETMHGEFKKTFQKEQLLGSCESH